MMSMKNLLLGALAGVGMMYFFDPQTGKRRRALLRDQMTKAQNKTTTRVEALAEDAANRTRGKAVETVHRFATEDVSDAVLAERVRSEMGRHLSRPGSVDVQANNGVVTLGGSLLATEVQPFVAKVRTIPGVRSVENNLRVREDAGNTPDLQGSNSRTEGR